MSSATVIGNERQLRERLEALRQQKEVQETKLINSSRNIYNTLTDPAPIIKKCVRDLVTDKEFGFDILKLGVHWISEKTAASRKSNGIGGKIGGFILGKVKDLALSLLK